MILLLSDNDAAESFEGKVLHVQESVARKKGTVDAVDEKATDALVLDLMIATESFVTLPWHNYVSDCSVRVVAVYVNVFAMVLVVSCIIIFENCFVTSFVSFLFFSNVTQLDNDLNEKKVMNDTLKEIKSGLFQLVEQVSRLVKVSGETKSNTKIKDEIDTDLLAKLHSRQLKELYEDFLSWELKPELASYHLSFMKHYLSLLVHYQEHRTCKVSEKFNKPLFHWVRNQKTYLKWYLTDVSEEKNGKFHIDNRYVKYLKKLGVTVQV